MGACISIDFITGWPFMPIFYHERTGPTVVKSIYIQAPMNYFLNITYKKIIMKGIKIKTHSTINDVFRGNFEYRAIKTSIPLNTAL